MDKQLICVMPRVQSSPSPPLPLSLPPTAPHCPSPLSPFPPPHCPSRSPSLSLPLPLPSPSLSLPSPHCPSLQVNTVLLCISLRSLYKSKFGRSMQKIGEEEKESMNTAV